MDSITRTLLQGQGVDILLETLLLRDLPEAAVFVANVDALDIEYLVGEEVAEGYLRAMSSGNFLDFLEEIKVLETSDIHDKLVRVDAVIPKTMSLITLTCSLDILAPHAKLLSYRLA